jgi:lysophospholipase L1-like esterase
MLKHKIFKYFVFGVCALAFLWGLFVIGKAAKRKWIVYVTLHSSHWQERVGEIEQVKPGKYKIIFLGNSLTELFDVQYYFSDSTILNCGIVGDFTEGLIKRAGTITRLKPEKLFIEIGINDMIEQVPLSKICDNYAELIGIIKKECPATKIYIESNLPVIINRPSILTDDEDVNGLIREQNENLKKLAANTGCVYVDIYPEFIKERNLEALLVPDGIHLTEKAYIIWANKVKGYLPVENK